MEAWVQGQGPKATDIKPVTINLTMEHIVERPRRKIQVQAEVKEPWLIARGQRWPPNCPHADQFIKSSKEVGCLDLKDWIPLEKCWRCFITREGSNMIR